MAREEETRESLFRIYLAGYPNYTKDTYETFDQFYEKCRPKIIQIDTRSKAEIMSEIMAIEDKFKTTE
ncbi:MAG: hypothetical protein K0M69_17225 [Youngiibacter sp.]|nr:hypothetical protein [Youngiibacter sp.]